jgi:hypothetical protein
MDPNKTLDEIRDLLDSTKAQEALNGVYTAGDEFAETLAELAEKVTALDDWLVRGGFLPTAWSKRGF